MSETPSLASLPLQEFLALLQDPDRGAEIEDEEILIAASEIADRQGARAIAETVQGRYQSAARIYETVASIWQAVAGAVAGDYQREADSLAKHWRGLAQDVLTRAQQGEQETSAPSVPARAQRNAQFSQNLMKNLGSLTGPRGQLRPGGIDWARSAASRGDVDMPKVPGESGSGVRFEQPPERPQGVPLMRRLRYSPDDLPDPGRTGVDWPSPLGAHGQEQTGQGDVQGQRTFAKLTQRGHQALLRGQWRASASQLPFSDPQRRRKPE